jgi:hypothetical protein
MNFPVKGNMTTGKFIKIYLLSTFVFFFGAILILRAVAVIKFQKPAGEPATDNSSWEDREALERKAWGNGPAGTWTR